MLRVAVSLSAARTLKSGHYLYEFSMVAVLGFFDAFCVIFRSSGCPRVGRKFLELSSAHNCECSRAPGGAGVAGSLTPR